MSLIEKPTEAHFEWWRQKLNDQTSISNSISNDHDAFLQKLNTAVNNNHPADISIDGRRYNDSEIKISAITLKCVNTFNISITNLKKDKSVILENLAISKLKLETLSDNTPKIIIRNCLIKNISINFSELHGRANVRLENSGIFTLKLEKKSIFNFYADGGYILNIQCPATYEDNPISGSVTIRKNVHLGIKKVDEILAEVQGYRNMRHHTLQLNNSLAANKFHAAELAVLRKTEDSWFTRIISKLYEMSSDYGSSIGKPIAFLLGLAFIFTLATFQFDDPVLVDEVTKGWKGVLTRNDCWGRLARASTNTLQNSLNPLGVLGYKSIVIPQSGWFVLISMIYNLFSVVLITLTILAIRRRFRIQSGN